MQSLTRVVGEDHPSTLTAMYNLACIAALRGNREKALQYLRRITDLGFRNDLILRDPDLASLHDDPEFQAIVADLTKPAGKP